MMMLLMSVFLFGMTHPFGKVFLDSDISLQSFCLVFLALRILFQLPVVSINKEFKVSSKKNLILLVVLGLIGAALHLSEFASLKFGLSVPAVSFLIFTHPIWTQLIRSFLFKEQLTAIKVSKVLIAVFAISLILIPENFMGINYIPFLIAFFASVAFSLWIIFSEKIQDGGVSTIQLSFYYDVFSLLFVSLSVLVFIPVSPLVVEISSLKYNHWLSLLFYSLFVGVIANYLFFIGIKKCGSMQASLALLLEPIISSFISFLLFSTHLDPVFYLGALLILLINLPDRLFSKFISSFFQKRRVSQL